MKTYTRFDIQVVRIVTECDLLQTSIHVQKQEVKVDPYETKEADVFDFNLDSFGSGSFE